MTVSAGLATFPVQGVGRDELIRLADTALYWAKEHGQEPGAQSIARTWSSSPSCSDSRSAPTARAASARRRASRRPSTRATPTPAATPTRVGELAPGSRTASALDPEQVELTRLAGSLHDLGKLAIPEEILRKPGR